MARKPATEGVVESPVRRWLKSLRAHYGLDQRELAETIGVSRSLIGMYETGTSIPDDTIARIVREFPDVRPPKSLKSAETPELLPKNRILGDAEYVEGTMYAEVVYAGSVPASTWGDPLTADTSVRLDGKFAGPQRFATKVTGDSCYPALRQGDMAVWETDYNPPHGVIVIAQRDEDDGCTVKQLMYDAFDQRDVLKPINPRYDSPPDGCGWRATARLVGVIRNADGPEKTWYWAPGIRPKHLIDASDA